MSTGVSEQAVPLGDPIQHAKRSKEHWATADAVAVQVNGPLGLAWVAAVQYYAALHVAYSILKYRQPDREVATRGDAAHFLRRDFPLGKSNYLFMLANIANQVHYDAAYVMTTEGSEAAAKAAREFLSYFSAYCPREGAGPYKSKGKK